MLGMMRDLRIRILKKHEQSTGWSGAYDFLTGEIFIGSTEKDVANVLEHEHVHKLLHEKYDLESAYLWDRIAEELGVGAKEPPYTWHKTERPQIFEKGAVTAYKAQNPKLPKTWKEDYGTQKKHEERKHGKA